MTEEEENQIETLELFKGNMLSFQEIHNYHLKGEEDLYAKIHTTTISLIRDGYAKKEFGGSGDIAVLNNRGQKLLNKLKQKKIDEDIAKIHFQDEKILVRQVHQSTLDTNKSVRQLNNFQIPIIIIGALIAIGTLWVLVLQYISSDAQGKLIEQQKIQQDKTNKQIETMSLALDSMRVLYPLDSSAKTKKKP